MATTTTVRRREIREAEKALVRAIMEIAPNGDCGRATAAENRIIQLVRQGINTLGRLADEQRED